MAEEHGDQSYLKLWRAGDQQAARELFDRYVDRLLALAHRRLDHRLAGRVDAEDIVQSVFRTFFHRAKENRFDVKDPDDISKLLFRITIHKTLRQIAFHRRGKRDAQLEAGAHREGDELLMEQFAGEPTPEEAATLVDEMEHFLSQLKPEERQILEMRMEGYNNQEISEKMDISDRKIRRLLERLRGLAQREEEAT
jgi:RNA polymerase sigma-70 factor (ECF subfamily)